MRRLAGALEILDGPLPDETALVGNLRDLRRTNRWLWGTSLSLRAVDALLGRHAADSTEASILDVGTGSADIPLALLARAERDGRVLRVVATDARPEVLAAARQLDPSLDGRAGLVMRVADGSRLPFADGAFDVAHTSLVLHHLEPEDAVRLLAELDRVARVGVVVNDLLRSRRNWAGARVLAAVATRNPLTRNDGPLSVRRAYTEPEARSLLARAGLRPIAALRDPLRQRFAIAAVAAEP
ncbi:MAG TPA: methyltransferase domain-containing protein [Candidatus Limnocylindrales bacterium]|nr:methyltransferase domain-containing protein [Candidatus Limnocylindrales bacterium]